MYDSLRSLHLKDRYKGRKVAIQNYHQHPLFLTADDVFCGIFVPIFSLFISELLNQKYSRTDLQIFAFATRYFLADISYSYKLVRKNSFPMQCPYILKSQLITSVMSKVEKKFHQLFFIMNCHILLTCQLNLTLVR